VSFVFDVLAALAEQRSWYARGMTPTWIAEERVLFVHADGRRSNGRIAVGLPTRMPTGEAACPIALDGLERLPPISGESELQALCLALGLLGMRLHDFVSRGGRVLEASGEHEELPLAAVLGPLFRDAPGR